MKTITVRVLNRTVFTATAPLKLADATDAYHMGNLNVAPKDRVPHGDMAKKIAREQFAYPEYSKKHGKEVTRHVNGYPSSFLGGFVRR